MKVIDFHVHLPLALAGGDAEEARRLLLGEMDSAGVSMAVVIAIEASPEVIRRHVTPEGVRMALQPVAHDWRALTAPGLSRAASDPEGLLDEQLRLVREHLAPSEAVVGAAAASGGRLVAVASYCRLPSVEEYIERLEDLKARGPLLGVKIYPTFHFIRPDDPSLEPLYDYMEDRGLVLIVHTGCDPGIWELPAFCAHANPRYIEPVARRHRDLTIIAAHMGSYSYLQPGIFFAEAVRLARNNPNVYLDTSATTVHQVKRALEKLPVEKLLYGSDYPYFAGVSLSESVEALASAALPERVKERLMRDNAVEVLSQAGVKVRV